LDSLDIKLKWNTSASNSIKIVSSIVNPGNGITNILFGGYDRSIRCISDFERGEKPILEIPYNITIPESQPTEADKKEPIPIKFETVPTNIREYIFKYLIDNRIIEGIGAELEKKGYLTDSVVEEFQRMISEKSDSFDKKTYSVWTLPEDKIGIGGTTGAPVKKGKKIRPVVVEQEITPQKGEALIDALKKERKKGRPVKSTPSTETVAEINLKTIITTHLENFKLIPTKNKLIEDIVLLGYGREVVEKQIDKLRMDGILVYSRSEPKGWSLGTY